MKKNVKLGITVFLTLCFCVLGLAACGAADGGGNKENAKDGEAEVSSITVNKDGSITSRIVEDFGESYYDVDELKAMIETAAWEYVNASSDSDAQAKLKSCKAADGMVNVVMEFGDYKSYAGFNREHFFAGTIQEANQAGFDLDMTLQAAAEKVDKTSVSKPELLGMGDSHIVIVDTSAMTGGVAQFMRVNCFGEILYVGDGVTAVGKKSADVELTGGYGIIVFK